MVTSWLKTAARAPAITPVLQAEENGKGAMGALPSYLSHFEGTFLEIPLSEFSFADL